MIFKLCNQKVFFIFEITQFEDGRVRIFTFINVHLTME